MVYGYSEGTWNPVLRTLTYHDSDAHSWLEVWNQSSRSYQRIDPTSWVLNIKPESSSTFIQGFKGNAQFILVLFVLGLGLILVFLFQDPRIHLQSILKTKGPISKGLRDASKRAMERGELKLARRIDQVQLGYEDYYFSKKSSLPTQLRVGPCIQLTLLILALYPHRKRILA
jgi:hypothetical protein